MTLRNGEGPLLRLTEHAEATPGRYRVEVALEGHGPRATATSSFDLAITAQDREDLRWYLEDYLLFPLDPAPEIAKRVEDRMAELGDALFKGVFHANDDARDLWAQLRKDVARTRVEVITDVRHAASVPWELMRDPKTRTPLALEAHAFVRTHSSPAKPARRMEAAGAGPIRILLVICRPSGGADVPFRSVARKLLDGLDKAAREVVSLDVLRPPTFDMLSRTLRDAKDRGEPYHVVHFDGHGAYTDKPGQVADVLSGAGAHVFGPQRKGAHGYLAFESADEAGKERGQLVDGPSLGTLLYETEVPVLVLNACRSAHADPPETPETAGEGSDVHGDVASFGSLALEVMDKGVSGVVAMRYNVYVVTAAQFVADLYGALAGGLALGEAVTRGRKQLHDQPMRTIAYDPRKLEDWPVPIVYEAERLPLFPSPASKRDVKLTLDAEGGGEDRERMIGVPPAPDAGFFGRDETLLALDRAFDKHRVVLLHAYAGSGKSSAAAEFKRWYARTGGVEGPVLWTSFERRMTLPQVLDLVGRVFEGVLEQNGIQWLALDDGERRRIALQVLAQVPVLWVWDNVEPVAGFPTGTASAWTAEEQGELVDFLREARGTMARFLLTSRRDEQAWLGELPARIAVPAMPMQERVQLARALAEKRGARLDKVGDWRPLLAFTQGNPLAITVLVGQALRDGVRTKEQVEAFVEKLRTGESAFEDEASEGRSRSLGASLNYGFESAFGEEDKKKLALLHLFQGFVNVNVLRTMGNEERDWCLPEVRGLSHEAGITLLDRAAETGLLWARGGGHYSIHPAVPWFLRGIFEEHYPAGKGATNGSSRAMGAVRAYVEATGELGVFYYNLYCKGHRDHLTVIEAEEPNLLHAWDLARLHGLWRAVTGTMQGLRNLYEHTGRHAEWARRMAEVKDDFVDSATDGPLDGREEQWEIINVYRVRFAREARQWAEAERLQQVAVRRAREHAAAVLAVPTETWNAPLRYRIRMLAASLGELGQIQRERGQVGCVATYTEAADMARSAGDCAIETTCAFNLGHAYMDLPAVRDIAQAERWYRRCLQMCGEEQRHDRAQCLSELGRISLERVKEAFAAKRPRKEILELLSAAQHSYHQALDLLPSNAVGDLAALHNALGAVYSTGGALDRALLHYQNAIRYLEAMGNVYRAGQTRFNVASTYAHVGRLADARAYALAALRNFETYGDRAADDIQKTRGLLAEIDANLSQSQPS